MVALPLELRLESVVWQRRPRPLDERCDRHQRSGGKVLVVLTVAKTDWPLRDAAVRPQEAEKASTGASTAG